MPNHWNSTIRIKPGAKPLKSKTSMKRNGKLKRSAMKRAARPMNKIGPRTEDWRRAWRWLKPRLEAADRVRCEFGFIPHECGGFLTPAHSKKRRLMKGPEIYHVAIACVNVHRLLDEQMAHEEMESAVMRAIEEHGGLILPDRY